jgi:hypothetical protein
MLAESPFRPLEVPMDAPQPPVPARPVVEISIMRLATTIFSCLALMFSFGALIVASDKGGSGKVVQSGSVNATPASAVLDSSAIPGGATAVTLSEFSISPKMVMVDKGGVLKVTNDGAAQHTLSVEGTDLVTPTLDPKGTAGLSLASLAPGSHDVVHDPGPQGRGHDR